LERDGRHLFDGGQVGPDTWEIYDWRTKELLAKGTGGFEGYDAALDRLDPDGVFYDSDNLCDAVPFPHVQTPGVPSSLSEVLEEWTLSRHAPAEEVAAFIGWTVEKVVAYREE
jgi:hypothetical protein